MRIFSNLERLKRPFVATASIGKAGPALKRSPDGAATFALDNPALKPASFPPSATTAAAAKTAKNNYLGEFDDAQFAMRLALSCLAASTFLIEPGRPSRQPETRDHQMS